MEIGYFLARIFEQFPEIPIKNRIRYFLAFNKHIPKSISDVIPIKGYELHYRLKPGDIVVDAGAFTGDYTIFAAKKVGSKGKVIAFEPDKKNRKILERNIKHDKIKNVIIVPKGLWSRNTFLKINEFNGLHSSLSDTNEGASVEVVTLDYELKKLRIEKIDFIKMDIEGAEIEAIIGAENTLKKHHPNLAIASYHIVNRQKTSTFLEKYLSKLGFTAKSEFPRHLTTYARKS